MLGKQKALAGILGITVVASGLFGCQAPGAEESEKNGKDR